MRGLQQGKEGNMHKQNLMMSIMPFRENRGEVHFPYVQKCGLCTLSYPIREMFQ